MVHMKKSINYIINTGDINDISVLNEKERKYFMLMKSQSGVLYLISKPGLAKSAILKSIAIKLNYNYFDIRLSMLDETDIGLYPRVKEIDNVEYLYHVTPYWSKLSNDRPSIINFEELNRTTLNVRNAALQILLERQIGPFFKFNDNVFMVSSGNLGEDDDTDVEEFDKALDGRLIQIYHNLTLKEWLDYYANDNIHKSITNFLKSNPDYYYKYPSDTSRYNSYATPRSWTFLSDFIITNYGKDCEPNVFIDFIMEFGYGFVGDSITPFIRYCRTNKLTIDDILNDFDNNADEINNYNRDTINELLSNLKSKKFHNLKSKQINNLKKFLLILSDDEVVSYFDHLLDKEFIYKTSKISIDEDNIITKKNLIIKKFLSIKEFSKYKKILKEIFENQYRKTLK